MTISPALHAIIGVFGGGGGPAASGSSPRKEEGVLEKWLNKFEDANKRLAGEAVGAFVVSTILSFIGKAVRVAEHILSSIVFVAGPIGVWLMQKVCMQGS